MTPFAGMTQIRCEGLRILRTLSAAALPCRSVPKLPRDSFSGRIRPTPDSRYRCRVPSDQPTDESTQDTPPPSDPTRDPDEPRSGVTDEEIPGADRAETEQPDAQQAPKEWWDDPRLPWKGKPSRNDLLCWGGFSLSGVVGLVMIPLRPVLLGASPLALVAITGSRSGLVTIGALAAVGRADWWPIGLIIGIISAMKWDPLFWWAGKLWGHGLIDVVSSRSRWARMNAGRAERLARKYGIPAVSLTYVLPLPAAVIYATVGMAGMRLRTFVITDLIGSALICSLWVFLGFRLGQDAVNVVDLIARYSGYISIGLIVIVVANVYIQSRRNKNRQPAA